MTDVIEMTDIELLHYGRKKSKVTILENELLIRLEQKLEEEDGDYTRGSCKEKS